MKYLKLYLCLLVLTAFLCGCQETPKEVAENMRQYGKDEQMQASDITYCSIEELRNAELPEVKGKNLQLPDRLDLSGVEGVDLLHLKIVDDFMSEKSVEKYTSVFGIDKEKLKKGDAAGYGPCLTFDNQKDKCFDIRKNGGMAYLEEPFYEFPPTQTENYYDVYQDDISKEEVCLADGKINLKKFCGDVETWLEKNMPVEGISYKVSDVKTVKRAKKENGDKEMISLCAEYVHKGIALDSYSSISEEDKDFNLRHIVMNLSVIMAYADAKTPGEFTRNEVFAIDSSKPVDKVIDLKSAIRIFQEKMSGFGAVHIDTIRPAYALFRDDTSDNGEGPGSGITARPVYFFLVKNLEAEKEDEMVIIKPRQAEHVFFVDMVTGEFTTDMTY